MQPISKQIARSLLRLEAVFLRPQEPFTWASGIKSPIYCDNRLTLSDPIVRREVEDSLSALIREQYPEVEVVMGTATAGIAHAALVAERLGLPMGYVRGKAKDHGRTNQIEGRLPEGAKVVVVEDLVSTGGSSLEVVEVLRSAGAEVLGLVSIFTYGMQKAIDRFAMAGVSFYSLSSLDPLVEVAVEEGYITPLEAERILQFRAQPPDQSWMEGLS